MVRGVGLILTMIPWDDDANLGRAYNAAMALLPSDDYWSIFLDHDAMPTTGKWHRQFSEAIAAVPDAGAIAVMTNRIASPWQRCGDPQSNDIAAHRRFGAERANVRSLLDITETKGFGGVMFAVNKRAWRECGGFAHGLGCVDHSLHFRLRDVGRRIYMHEGIYVFHWRHFGEPDPTSMFPKAPYCPCRGPEPTPTQRMMLP